MDNRLTQTQLAQIVAGVDQLSKSRETDLSREQVQQILQELNLPPDLLDEALGQINRKQALEVQKRRNRWILGGVMVVLLGAIALTTVYLQSYKQAIARVSSHQSRVSLNENKSDNITEINRQNNPKVYYAVTLQNAPIGQKLSLNCDWIDPAGQIAHQNRYSTRQIDKAIWPTFCYYQFNSGAIAGNWTVQMSIDGRILSKNTFVVK
jgi:hypothetical protein